MLKIAPSDPREPGEERFDLHRPEQIDRYVTEEGEFAPDEIAALDRPHAVPPRGYALLLGDQ